ncbi:MAG TPA: aromatic/alkene monooxygenase hydroxylase subunit beta [Candidatus Binatia bacterium]|nr:aromatic/alkene monooxygenase hydroxylase subunit beta [Candidatus Binatia bacterium]
MAEAKTKALRTWPHLAARRRRPSEYEIVSTNLHWRTQFEEYSELSPSLPINKWYRKYVRESPLRHDDWDGFRDPDEVTYRTYTVAQDGQEAYVDGLLDEHDELGHDASLPDEWVPVLARLYTPGRFMLHAVQMASAYIVIAAPASTVTCTAAFQMGDALRWVARLAYRTAELAEHRPGFGFAQQERRVWEQDPAWQGLRELTERALVAYDWGEAIVALNVVLKPAIDEAFLRQLAAAGRRHGDTLLGLLADAQLRDSDRSRRWTKALVEYARQHPGNDEVLARWAEKWVPLGDRAMETFAAALPESPDAGATAVRDARAFRTSLGFTV